MAECKDAFVRVFEKVEQGSFTDGEMIFRSRRSDGGAACQAEWELGDTNDL